MSPSHLSSQLSFTPIDSPRVKFDGKRILPPQMASELNNHLPLLLSAPSSSIISSPSSIELPGILPLSPIRTATIILRPPPAARRSSIPSSYNPNPHSNPSSPIRSSRAAVPWPLITALSSTDHPQHEYEERNTSSGTSESTPAFRR